MFVQVGGVSHVFVFGAHESPAPQVDGHVTDFPQLLVLVVLHAFPHVVLIASGAQHALEPLQTSVDAVQHVPLQTTVDVQSHTLVVHVYPLLQPPQLASRLFPGLTSVPQFPPGSPASWQTGGPSHVPLSGMQACPPGHAFVQSRSAPQPLGKPLRQMLG
jgi:hypothetical protein